MPDQNETLSELLELEAIFFDKLNAVIADREMEESDVDALSLRYDICVRSILDYRAKSKTDLSRKCEFIFTMIARSYNEDELLDTMKESLLRDFEALTA